MFNELAQCKISVLLPLFLEYATPVALLFLRLLILVVGTVRSQIVVPIVQSAVVLHEYLIALLIRKVSYISEIFSTMYNNFKMPKSL